MSCRGGEKHELKIKTKVVNKSRRRPSAAPASGDPAPIGDVGAEEEEEDEEYDGASWNRCLRSF